MAGPPRLASALPRWFLWSPWAEVTRERAERARRPSMTREVPERVVVVRDSSPADPGRDGLYSPDELYDATPYAESLDARAYALGDRGALTRVAAQPRAARRRASTRHSGAGASRATWSG